MTRHDGFGIVADNANRRVTLFDIRTLEAFQQIPLEADVVDVAVTTDCRRAVVTSSFNRTLFQISLNPLPARVVSSTVSPTTLLDVCLTPDNRFALSADGALAGKNIVSYSLSGNDFVSILPAGVQSVAASPVTPELVLTTVYDRNSVRRFTISRDGTLVDTGQEFAAGPFPTNVNFSPDGRFAFVVDFQNGVSTLSTMIPDQVLLLGSAPSSGQPQSLTITSDGRHLFLLGPQYVDIYAFDAVAGSLTPLRSFVHGLRISSYFGVDQIALDPGETRLFISAVGQVGVFTTYGLRLGTVAGASGPGGLAICGCAQSCDPCKEME